MIRALILLFSACWAFLLLLPRARNHKFKEIFHVPRLAPIAVVIIVASLFTLVFLYNYVPQAGDAAYYFGASNRFFDSGHIPRDGHELSLGFVSLVRVVTERALGLQLSSSIIAITFALMLFNGIAVYRFTLAGTGNRSLSVLAMGIAPFSLFTFWFQFNAAYAQFLALSLFLLGISFYFQRALSWKPAVFFALGTLAHVWSGVVFALAFGVFLLLAKILRYEEFPHLASRAFKALAVSLSGILLIALTLRYWRLFIVEFNPLQSNPLFFVGLWESPFIALLAFIGLAVAVTRKTPFCLFLFSMALVTSVALFLYDTTGVARVMFMFPIPVLAALGIHRVWGVIRNRGARLMTVGGLLVAVALTGTYANIQYVDAQQLNVSRTQNRQTIDAIQAITETHGYGNHDIIIVIEDRDYSLLIWTEALTGARVVTEYDPSKDSPKEVVYLQSEH